MGHFDEAGALFKIGTSTLKGDAGTTTFASWIFRGSVGVTALSILTSIACGVYANGGFVSNSTSNPPNALLQVNIPFTALHLAIAHGIVVSTVLNVLFNLHGVGGTNSLTIDIFGIESRLTKVSIPH